MRETLKNYNWKGTYDRMQQKREQERIENRREQTEQINGPEHIVAVPEYVNSDGSWADSGTWTETRAAKPNEEIYSNRTKTYHAGIKEGLNRASKIAEKVWDEGEYHGESQYDSHNGIYQQGALEVYESIKLVIAAMNDKENGVT